MDIIFLLVKALDIYELIILVRIFMSWIRPDPNNSIISFINSITDPVSIPIRNLLPQNGMGIDFSPIIVFFIIGLIKRILLGGYASYGY